MPKRRFYRKKMNLKRMIKNEIKKNDSKKIEVKAETLSQATTSDNNGFLVPILQSIPTGVAHDQRIGNRTELLSMNLRIMNALADTGYNNCRYAIVKTRVPPPSVSSLFEVNSYALFGGVYASWDYDIVEKVYLDKNVTLNQTVSGARVSEFGKHFIKTPMELHYDTAAPGSLQEQLFLVLVSDSAVAPHPGVNYVLRSRFTDS